MNVVGYIRVSTDEQATQGHSLAAQETLIHQFAHQRGWPVSRIYCDAGLSGRSDQRPALAQLLQDAAAGRFEVVIVHAIDRLFRNLEALLKTLQHFQSHQVTFVSLTENMDFTTPWGKLTLAVLGTLAEIYIDKLSAETSKGKQQRARQGLWNGSIPLGYCDGQCAACTDPNGPGYCPQVGGPNQSEGGRLIPHPIEQIAVQQAFEWYVTGAFSDGEIAARLNDYQHRLADGRLIGLRTKGIAGRFPPGLFRKDTIRELLTRIFYTGLVPYFGVNDQGQKRKRADAVAIYPGQQPPLISQSLFDQAQEVRRLVSRTPRHRQETVTRVYPLSGLLHCARCQARMRGQGGSHGQRYYACPTRLQRLGDCAQLAVRAEPLEEQLFSLLSQLDIPADWHSRLLRHQGRDPTALEAQQAAIRQRLERAGELYLAGLLTSAQFQAERQRHEFALQDLQIVGLDDMMSVIGHLDEIKAVCHHRASPLTFETKRLLQSTLATVLVQGNQLTAIRFVQPAYPILATIDMTPGFYYESDGRDIFHKKFVKTHSHHPLLSTVLQEIF